MTARECIAIQVVAVALTLAIVSYFSIKEGPIVLPTIARPACVEPHIILGGNHERSL